MQAFSAIAMIFIIGGALGYLLELFYRRARHGKWINPGFLSGPFLPLYGVGTLLLFGICSLGDATFATTPWGKVFLILLITVAMTLAELVTGLIFAEGMKVRLWDYSGLWGNFRGIICPLFSLISSPPLCGCATIPSIRSLSVCSSGSSSSISVIRSMS